MKLYDIKTVKKVIIYGAINYRCFSIKCTPDEFEELKTDVLVVDISVYDSFMSISCAINSKRSQELISKAVSMGIQITYYDKEF